MRISLHLTLFVFTVLAGCGSDGKGEADPPQRGGKLLVLAGADIDTLDPGRTASATVVNLLGSVHRGLYHLRPESGLVPQPDLATGPPEVGAGGRSITVRLRRGVRFAPPVNREVVAADIKYGMERLLLKSLGSPPGAQALTDLEAIDTPDPHTVVIRLERPTAGTLLPQLTLPLGVPVPRELAREFDRKTTSTYGEHAVGTGPYMIEESSTSVVRLVRNPNWDPKTDDRPAHLSEIEFHPGQANADVAVRRIIRGKGMAGAALLTPPAVAARLSEARRRALFHSPPADQVMLLALNTQRRTFAGLGSRAAAARAIDRDLVVRVLGGPLFGRPAAHYIPPAVSGFRETRPEPPGPAKRPRGETVEFLAPNTQRKLAETLATELEEAGFRVRLHVLSQDAQISRCARADTAPDACLFGVALGALDPAILFDNVMHSKAINPQQTLNFARLSDPAVDEAIDRAEATAEPAARARAWATANERALATGAYVPLVWPRRPVPHSADVIASGTFELDYAYSARRR